MLFGGEADKLGRSCHRAAGALSARAIGSSAGKSLSSWRAIGIFLMANPETPDCGSARRTWRNTRRHVSRPDQIIKQQY